MEHEEPHPFAKVVCQCCHRFIAFNGQTICPFSKRPLKITSYQAIGPKPVPPPSESSLLGC